MSEPTIAFRFQDNFRDYRGLDRTRQRPSVYVGPVDAGQYDKRLVHLGDVWRVKATGRWYYSWGGGGISKGGRREGYDAPSEAAQAMLDEIIVHYRGHVDRHLSTLNRYRGGAGLVPLVVVEDRS